MPSWIPHREAGRCRLVRCPLLTNQPSVAPRQMCMYLFPCEPQSTSSDVHMASLGSQNKATGSGAWGITLQTIPEKDWTPAQVAQSSWAGNPCFLTKICTCPVGFGRGLPAPVWPWLALALLCTSDCSYQCCWGLCQLGAPSSPGTWYLRASARCRAGARKGLSHLCLPQPQEKKLLWFPAHSLFCRPESEAFLEPHTGDYLGNVSSMLEFLQK